MIPPVFSAAEIEHYSLAQLLVLDEECERRHIHGFMAFLYWVHKSPGGNNEICGGVDDGDLDSGFCGGEVEGGMRFWCDFLVGHDEGVSLLE